jgi:putative transcriptional regulator
VAQVCYIVTLTQSPFYGRTCSRRVVNSRPFFKRSQFHADGCFLTEHRTDGTIGFVINRQFENTLDELLPEVEGHPYPVYYGGPVQMNTIHFLHRYPDEIPGGVEVMKGVFWGGDFDAVIRPHQRRQH